MTSIVKKYFEDHPDDKNHVIKAYYAYHTPHFRLTSKGHNFTNGSRYCKCIWCERSREEVRHDDLPAECLNRPKIEGIQNVIQSEEERYYYLLSRADKEIPKIIKKLGLNGKTLAILHHTCGYDLDTAQTVLNIDIKPFMVE